MANGDIPSADKDDVEGISTPPTPPVPGKPKGKNFIETVKSGRKIPTGKPADPAKKAQFQQRMKAMSGRSKAATAKKSVF